MNPTMMLPADPGALAAATSAINKVDEVDEDTAKLVSQWRTRLNQAYAHDEHARKGYADDRRVARGDTTWLVDTNLVGAILEILEAFVFAKEPDFEVSVSESVNNTRGKQLKEVTDTLRIVVSRLARAAGLKLQGERWVRSAQTVGVGWLKPSLTTHTIKDPIVQKEINTLKENLARLKVLEQNLADDEVADEGAAAKQIEANIIACTAKLERSIANGLVIDYFSADDIQVSPECGELINYLQAPWIRIRTYKSKEEGQAITGFDAATIGKANVYTQKRRADSEQGSPGGTDRQNAWLKVADANAETADGFVCFEEVWSKRDGVVYTMIDGINDRWAKEPYAPVTGSRFYDVFMLAFHFTSDERHPQSDVHQLKKLQDEYGRTRSNWAEHRKRNIPKVVWDAAEIDPSEMKKINDAEAGENIAINFSGATANNMQNRYFAMNGTPIDPAQYNTMPITTDMEKVSGAQDAMQSGVAVEKTATEANIQNNGFGARISTRRSKLESVLGEMGLWIAQVALLKLPESEAVRIAGPDAVWPTLTVDEVMGAFDIEVKAGSTGKPNKEAKKQAFSVALPMIEKMCTVIGNFRTQGEHMEWAAKPYIAMMEDMFEHLDMTDDVERYLPHPPPPPPADPMAALMAGLTGQAPPGPPMAPVLDAQGSPPATPTATAGIPAG